MKNKKVVSYVLFIVMVLILAACGSNNEDAGQGSESVDENEQNEELAAERETLELTFEVVSIDVENNTLQASFETNLPVETDIYRLILKDEEGKDRFVEYETTIDEENEINFSLNGADKDTLLGETFQLSLELNVTEKTNSDLSTDEAFGGSFAEMNEAYEDSEHILVKDLGVDEAYTVSIVSTNEETVGEEQFVE